MARLSMIKASSAAPIVAAIVGAFIATAVIGYFNYHAVLAAMAPVGWRGSGLVILCQVALFAPLGLAWFLVAPGEPIGRIGLFSWSRLMREAASDVLPFSQLGGFLIGIRALVLGGVAGSLAIGSGVVDLTAEIVSELAYTLFGVGLLVTRMGAASAEDHLVYPLLIGLVIAAALVSGFIFAQRRGLAPLERLAQRIAPKAAAQSAEINRVIEAAYRQPARLWAAVAVHIGCWIGGALGTWLILWLIDRPLPLLSVIAIESLMFAIRNAAVVVPNGLGVQEGAYAVLGPLFGLPAEAALALSLLKRGRDIVIAIPMLLTWQVIEGRRARSRANGNSDSLDSDLARKP
jgi:putative membrane protein